MARARTTEEEAAATAADAAAALEFAGAHEPADDLASLSVQFGNLDGIGLRAYRYERNGTLEGWAFLGRFPAAEFELDGFSVRFGPGRYRFQVAGPGGRCLKTFQQLIGAPVAAPAPPPAAAVSAPGHGPEQSDDSLLRVILMQSMKSQGDVLAALVASLARGSGGGMTAADMLAAFRVGQESAGTKREPFEPVLEAVRAGMEIAGGQPREDGGSPLTGLGSQVMTLLERLLSRPPAQQIHVSGQAPASDGGRMPGPAAPPARGVAVHPLIGLAQKYAPTLLKEAQRGHDPITFGHFIAERCPDALVDPLHRLASCSPAERMGVLSQILPELAGFAGWIDLLCTGILEVIEEPDEETAGDVGGGQVRTDPDSAGGTGNLAERQDHSTPDPAGVGAAGGAGVRGADRTGDRPG